MSEFRLELKNITKVFPGVKALDRVSFQLLPGEIHAIMGENGAGKSTFIKVITGVHQPDEGSVFMDGRKVEFKTPLDAQRHGIAAIYQHVTSYPHLSVAENIFMGHECVKGGLLQWKEMNRRAEELLRPLGVSFSATALMSSLSVAQQQMVEIAKALSMNANIIIMDEPTAALTKSESEELYRITEALRDEGTSIIFISHRLEDMYRLASRVTVFRDAHYIGTYDAATITEPELIKAMVGREIKELFPKPSIVPGEEVLQVEGLSHAGYFKDISLNVRRGEIVGLTGLVGAGRTEVVQTLFGVERYDAGKIFLEGKPVSIKKPQDAMRLGIGLLTEDRQQQGLLLDWGIGRNITLSELKRYAKYGVLSESEENADAKRLAERVDVRAVSIFDACSSLSGGNQQKVVVAKALNSSLKVLIMDEPTKGVDVGAKAAVYEIMGELAEAGLAVIMISSEMPEILGMCDRIFVMCDGRMTGELSRAEATQERILELAMRKHAQPAQGA